MLLCSGWTVYCSWYRCGLKTDESIAWCVCQFVVYRNIAHIWWYLCQTTVACSLWFWDGFVVLMCHRELTSSAKNWRSASLILRFFTDVVSTSRRLRRKPSLKASLIFSLLTRTRRNQVSFHSLLSIMFTNVGVISVIFIRLKYAKASGESLTAIDIVRVNLD